VVPNWSPPLDGQRVTWLEPIPFPPRGWGTIHLPGCTSELDAPPLHHPAISSRAVKLADPKPNLSWHCTHATCPTQMNRAPERIYPKPMVDGLEKSLDEFRSGCDEKVANNIATVNLYKAS